MSLFEGGKKYTTEQLEALSKKRKSELNPSEYLHLFRYEQAKLVEPDEETRQVLDDKEQIKQEIRDSTLPISEIVKKYGFSKAYIYKLRKNEPKV
jgi:hypothetical protein